MEHHTTLAFPVVIFRNKDDNRPVRHDLSWVKLADRLCRFDERAAKDGKAWSPVSYRPQTTRGKANVEQIHALVLDIDHQDPPEDLLSGREYVAHTTHSHSAGDSRWRVILPLTKPIDAEDWPEFWLRANAFFGGCVDPATKDSSRIFYLPSYAPGGPHEARKQEGRLLDPAELPEVPRYEPPKKTTAASLNSGLQTWAERFCTAKVNELAGMPHDSGRNSAANRIAYLLAGLVPDREHGLNERTLAEGLYAACETNGLVADDGQRSVEATISSGLTAGLTKAWSPADLSPPVTRVNGHTQQHVVRPGLLDLVAFSTIEPEEISWLWQGRLARGKLTVLMGDPGLGKSLVTVHCAAVVSTGGTWPDGERCGLGAVIVLTAEDGPSDTVRPRLDAAGADVEKVFLLRGVKDEPGDEFGHMFRLQTDIAQLEEAVTQTHAKLIIIDPLNAYLGGVDSHKAAEVRGVLAPLAAMSDRTGVALLVLHHLNKGTSANALYRAGGSLDFVAAARSVLGVVPDPDQPDRRLMVSVKVNIAQRPAGLGYHIKSSVIGRPSSPPIVDWDHDPVGIDPVYAFVDASTPEDRWQRKEIKDVLLEILRDGEAPADVVKAGIKGAGVQASEKLVRNVGRELGVRISRRGFGPGGQWVWELDRQTTSNGVPSMPSMPSMTIGGTPQVPSMVAEVPSMPSMTIGGIDGIDSMNDTRARASTILCPVHHVSFDDHDCPAL